METTRSSSLYFENGDTVLSAKASSTSRRLFRAHWVFLCQNSEIFRDMFHVATESRNIETYDGVPLVSMLKDDNAEDLVEIMHRPAQEAPRFYPDYGSIIRFSRDPYRVLSSRRKSDSFHSHGSHPYVQQVYGQRRRRRHRGLRQSPMATDVEE